MQDPVVDAIVGCVSADALAVAAEESAVGYRLGREWAQHEARPAILQAIVRVASDPGGERLCAVPIAVLADPELNRLDCEDFWERVSRRPNRSEAFATGFVDGAAEFFRTTSSP